MKLFDREHIQKWDLASLEDEDISSHELMERAASRCTEFILQEFHQSSFRVICGTGNNGGDGLAIARMLIWQGLKIEIYLVGPQEKGSPDFKVNLEELIGMNSDFTWIEKIDDWSDPDDDCIIIDCLFGTGLSRPVQGTVIGLIQRINSSKNIVISIDVPSGMDIDLLGPQSGDIVEADITLTFQTPKRIFLFRENDKYIGELIVLDIGLAQNYENETTCNWQFTDQNWIHNQLFSIEKHAFKNSRGHLQLIAGSIGKSGAAVLSAKAAQKAGCGLVTAFIPRCTLTVMQTSIPEVMCETDEGENFLMSSSINLQMDALAMGPGIGTEPQTSLMLRKMLLEPTIPMVLDADALNLIAEKNLIAKLPKNATITPHIGEFDRLFGKHENTFDRLITQRKKSAELGIIIVLKGAYTAVACPDEDVFFNSTGNPGMATAGSGDVLTGIIGSLLAQGYDAKIAAILGVYLHGLAGDMAAQELGIDGLIASDIIQNIPYAWKEIRKS
ncbi:MAG: NAD(P)H-hydrate dehydratase [Flavobacteriales bacterium]|nr:NAD(P)H-hydrate dehydratase [Flavobacteriales bacterium]